ncbi:MAG TPA: hypothetical protein V6D07_15625 [Trichocoleus sp.]
MKKSSTAQLNIWLVATALLYLCLFLIILWLAYTHQLPDFLQTIPHYDKPGHVILYALAAYLGHRTCRYRRFPGISLNLPGFPAFFALFTVSEELLQSLSPYRTLDAVDLIASFAGIVLGWWLAEQSRPVI